jgi:hypothetical protein
MSMWRQRWHRRKHVYPCRTLLHSLVDVESPLALRFLQTRNVLSSYSRCGDGLRRLSRYPASHGGHRDRRSRTPDHRNGTRIGASPSLFARRSDRADPRSGRRSAPGISHCRRTVRPRRSRFLSLAAGKTALDAECVVSYISRHNPSDEDHPPNAPATIKLFLAEAP